MEQPEEKNEQIAKPSSALKAVFWALVVIFMLIVLSMFGTPFLNQDPERWETLRSYWIAFFFTSTATFFILGLVLLFMSRKQKIEKRLKKFLMLTGASSTGFLVSVLLHNFVYGLFIYWGGADFWERNTPGGDEPFFFILAIFVCPIAFLIGALGSAILLVRKNIQGVRD